jgi:hypothetical protein
LLAGLAPLLPAAAVVAGAYPPILGLGAWVMRARGAGARTRWLVAAFLAVTVGLVWWWWSASGPVGIAGLAVAGAGVGLVISSSLLPGYTALVSLRVVGGLGAAERALRAGGHGDLARLMEDAWRLWVRVELAGPALVTVRRPLHDAVLRLGAAAARFAGEDPECALPGAAEISARLDRLATQIAACTDAGTRRDLEDARRAREAQLVHREAIVAGRARMEARLHAFVASMEALHLAALGLRAADLAAASEPLREIIDALDRRGQDVNAMRAAVEDAGGAENAETTGRGRGVEAPGTPAVKEETAAVC